MPEKPLVVSHSADAHKPAHMDINLDHQKREVTVTWLPAFGITPLSLTVPFFAVKGIAGNIALAECQAESVGRPQLHKPE